jgi:leukotriene-A4 hydrolase
MADVTVDTTTQSNPHDIATEHVAFDWKVDFDAQTLHGSATHTLKVKKDGIGQVMCVYIFLLLLFNSLTLN